MTSSLYSTFFLPLSHPLFFIKSATPQQATGNHQVDHLYNELTGELTTVDFEDPNSIDIEYPDYNRLGLPEEIRDVTGSRKLTYDLDGDLSLKGRNFP